MPKDYPTSIRLSAEVKLGLMRAARAQGTNVTWMVEHVCKEWLAQKEAARKAAKQTPAGAGQEGVKQ